MSLFSMDQGAKTGITALAGGALTAATPMMVDVNVVSAVATAQDSIVLPTAAPGKIIAVKNSVATAGKVYVDNGGTLDGTNGTTGVASGLAASKTTLFACTGFTAGTVGQASVWVTLLASA